MSYYKHIDGVAYDRSLLDRAEALTKGRGDGRISQDDIESLVQLAQDGGRITDIERRTLHYIRAHFRFTEKADEWLTEVFPFSNDFDEKVEEILRNELDFEGMRWVVEEAEARRQEAISDQQDFFEALREAVHAILYEAESSTSLRDVIYLETGADLEDIDLMRSLGRVWMNEGTLHLVPLDWEQQAKEGKWTLPMPFYEPLPEEYWVFVLEIPSRTKYLFTAEVRRTEFKQAYSAGYLPENRTLEEWAERIVGEEFQITGLEYLFNYEEAKRQEVIMLGSKVKKFPDALRQALVCFIQHEQSPSSLLRILAEVYHDEIAPEQFPYPGAYWQALQAKAKEVLKEGILRLIPLNIKELSQEERGDLQAPEDGESPAQNWIFQLRLTLSDHVYWAIVSRIGERQPYNYGFN